MTAAPASGPALQRDRFLAFTFAASDLLIEAAPDGTITFADGAFNARFGAPPSTFVGHDLRRLVAPRDHVALDVSLDALLRRGRLAPMVIHLGDSVATPMSLSGLCLPGDPPRLCLTLGRLPVPPVEAAGSVTRTAQAALMNGGSAELSLLDVQGWAQTKANLGAEQQRALQAEITAALVRLGGPGSVAEELADGRYGVVAQGQADVAELAAGLDQVLRTVPGASRGQTVGTGIPLGPSGLTAPQAARALRFALGQFASNGAGALAQMGFGDGLAGFVSGAEHSARALRAAIAERRFKLAFQPIVHLATRKIHHFEALLRPLPVPGTPLQNTQAFVSFTEAVGLSEELDAAVLQAAAVAIRAARNTSVAVNVSGYSMQSASFRDIMLPLLRDKPSNGSRLMVELTETADIEDVPSAKITMDGLREAGIEVSLDDFGAGSSAFRYLREFRVDYVKLDGAYVRGAMGNAREHGFLLSMVELANFVGAKTIAEMIETQAEAELMAGIGAEFGQGYLFGKPGSLPGSL